MRGCSSRRLRQQMEFSGSPPMRGCSGALRIPPVAVPVLPADAGVLRPGRRQPGSQTSYPRACGGDCSISRTTPFATEQLPLVRGRQVLYCRFPLSVSYAKVQLCSVSVP